MAKTLAEFLTALKIELRDATSARWSEAQLTEHIQHAVRDISVYAPRERTTELYCVNESRDIDISSLDDFLSLVQPVEYPVDENPRQWCNGVCFANVLTMDLTSAPSASPTGQLTGTVTFTADSTAVSGSGTAFDTELVAGYYIKPSGGSTWYKVASIEDAEGLTLASAVETDDDGADDADSTDYWYEQVRVYYRAVHSLAGSASTLPSALDQLVLDGAAAYASLAWAEEVRNNIEAAVSQLTTAETAIGAIDTKMDLGFGTDKYLETGDDFIGAKDTELDAALAKVEAEVDQAVTDLDTGRDLINTVNVGDSVAANYASYAARGVGNAASYIQEMRAYLQRDSISQEYLNYARACLEAAQVEAAQARSYMQDCAQRLSISGAIAKTQQMAQTRLVLFQQQCQIVATRYRRKVRSYAR